MRRNIDQLEAPRVTEYEMASLHVELFSAIQGSLTVWLSVVSGFLAISYFAARRLNALLAAMLLVGFIGFLTLNVLGTGGLLNSYAGLTRQMQVEVAAGRGLAWHNAAHLPTWIVDSLRPTVLAGGAISIVMAVYFFFSCRRDGSQAS